MMLIRQQGSDADDGNPDWEGGVTNNEFEDVGWMYMQGCDYYALGQA